MRNKSKITIVNLTTGNIERAPRRRPIFSRTNKVIIAASLMSVAVNGYNYLNKPEEPAPLPKPSTLPGYGKTVSMQDKRALAASAISLSYEDSSVNGQYRICSANKVTTKQQKAFVLTATHCFQPKAASQEQVMSGSRNLNNPLTENYSITPINVSDYAAPIATVSEARSLTRKDALSDYALLNVNARKDKFDTIPGIPSERYVTDSINPTPGQQAYVYNNNPEMTHGAHGATGTYLGRIVSNNLGSFQSFDVVGLTTKYSKETPCLPGSSGSSAVLADRQMLGPASYITYDPEKLTGFTAPQDPTPRGQVKPEDYETSLVPVDTNDYSVLCHFSVQHEGTIDKLAQSLQTRK